MWVEKVYLKVHCLDLEQSDTHMQRLAVQKEIPGESI